MQPKKNKNKIKGAIHFVSATISWTIFALLLICLVLLLYYFISTKLYAAKGNKFEPAFSLYTIISPSMVPNIKVYDIVVNTKVDKAENIKIGDVITFISKSPECMGATVTHRVVSISKDTNGNISYQTKGDNNLIADSASVTFDRIIGKVSFKIPQLGRIQIFLANNSRWMMVLFLVAVYILLKDFIKAIKKYANLDKLNKYKIFRILNRKILPGRRLKLLPEPKLAGVQDFIDDNDLPTLLNNDIKDNIYSVNSDDEEINIEDLPKLK